MTKLEQDNVTDLEELMSWVTRIVLFGGLAAVIIIGLVGLFFWVLNGTQPTWP